MKKMIFLDRHRGRYFHSPRARNDILAVGMFEFLEFFTPEILPHRLQAGVVQKRSAFSRVKRPVFAAAPIAAVLIPSGPERIARFSTLSYRMSFGQKTVHQ